MGPSSDGILWLYFIERGKEGWLYKKKEERDKTRK